MHTIRKLSAIIGAVLLLGTAGAIIYTFNQNKPSVPEFSYDESVGGWWSSQANLQALAKSMGSTYTGNEPIGNLPIADLTMHHGEKDTKKTADDNCFVAFSYYDYRLDDIEAAYADYESRKQEQGELSVLAPLEKSLPTFEGDMSYQLRRYDYTITGEDVLSGYEVGFLNLSAGHIRVEGVCKTADNLAGTLPVLEAVSLNEH